MVISKPAVLMSSSVFNCLSICVCLPGAFRRWVSHHHTFSDFPEFIKVISKAVCGERKNQTEAVTVSERSSITQKDERILSCANVTVWYYRGRMEDFQITLRSVRVHTCTQSSRLWLLPGEVCQLRPPINIFLQGGEQDTSQYRHVKPGG